MNLWLIIIGMGLVTFGIRLVPIVLLGRIEIPLVVPRALVSRPRRPPKSA
jgi:branched-subunit amino acid transport protein